METNYFLTWLERKFLHRQTNFQLNLIRVTCEERKVSSSDSDAVKISAGDFLSQVKEI
ncbi:hypothetical protein BHE74_00016474 [Ensete ventricosum]|uniref:Uncharacterized protein n=1 Tax=Ensete ventricosum TaxID=4639 RepID=A0A427B278_ENSVE|nr:hypothetical protein B296_00014599 [Ensete ventricosum]RWW75506.1 hypothetical protein BHE74_00016474 [Ensete ventricosum]